MFVDFFGFPVYSYFISHFVELRSVQLKCIAMLCRFVRVPMESTKRKENLKMVFHAAIEQREKKQQHAIAIKG